MASSDAGLLVFTAALFPPTLDRAELCNQQIIASVTVGDFRGDDIKGLEASASLSFGLPALRKPAAVSSGHSGGPVKRPTWKGAEACSPLQPNQPPHEWAASGVGPPAQPGLPMTATRRTVRPQPHAQPQGGTLSGAAPRLPTGNYPAPQFPLGTPFLFSSCVAWEGLSLTGRQRVGP